MAFPKLARFGTGRNTPDAPHARNGGSRPSSARTLTILSLLALSLLIFGACASPFTGPESVVAPAVTQAPAEEPAPPVDDAAPDQETYLGIPVGFTEEGYPYRGSPDAPITVYEFSDFHCPFCARHATQTEPAITESYIRTGQVRFVFREFPLAELHPKAPVAHNASLCVAEQSVALYWAMHDQIFRTQQQGSAAADPMQFYRDLAETVGADMDAYDACVTANQKAAIIAKGLEDGRAIGFTGTPSFQFVRAESGESFTLVGAQPYDVFAQWMDTLLAGGAPVDPAAQQQQQQQAPQGIPFWATAEGLAADPERPGYTVAGDQYLGNLDAAVVVVEFSDFQCPYCRRHTLETQPALDEQFVDTGEILWVFKHFPLSIHPQAPLAGVASECAAEQGMFWEMHDVLFEQTELWGASDPAPGLTTLAEEIGLDMDQFSACLADPAIMERVDSDLADGAPFVQGTPTFIVLYGGQGRIIPGALPLEQFAPALRQMVDEATGAGGGG